MLQQTAATILILELSQSLNGAGWLCFRKAITRRKHFLFTFHDDTFECLADDLTLEVVSEPYSVIFERIRRRALAEDAG